MAHNPHSGVQSGSGFPRAPTVHSDDGTEESEKGQYVHRAKLSRTTRQPAKVPFTFTYTAPTSQEESRVSK